MQDEETLNLFLKQFGEKAKMEREKRNLTLADLESLTTIDLSDLHKIEQGKRNLTFKTFLKISSAYNLHPKDLLDFEFDIKK